MRLLNLLFTCIAALTLMAPSASWAQEEAVAALRSELEAFVQGAEVRYAGSPGNLAMEQRVADRFAGSGFAHGEIVFAAPTLVPGEARLVVDGQAVPIHAMHPSVVRPGNFAQDSFETHLVYLGQGEMSDIQAVSGVPLDGAIALMDYDSGDTWKRLLRFGFIGFIFIGDDQYTWRDSAGKIYHTEGATPRYFVEKEAGRELRERLLQARQLAVTIEAEPTRWNRQDLRNLWVFIPGADPDLERNVVVFTAPMDSNSIVPERAYGGQYAANLYLLMQMLDQMKETPPGHSVLLVALNAHCQGFRGERELAWYLQAPIAQVEKVRGGLARSIRWEQMMLSHYRKLAGLEKSPEFIDLLIEMRTMVDDSTGRRVTVKDPIVALARRDVNLQKAELLRISRSDLTEAEKAVQEAAVKERMDAFVSVLILFNRVRPRKTLDEVSDAELEILRGYIADLTAQYTLWSEKNQRQLAQDEANTQVRDALGGRPVAMVINLALNWGGNNFGFTSETQKPWARRLGSNSTRIARVTEEELGFEPGSRFLDTMTRLGGRSEPYYFGGVRSGLYEFHTANRTPAVSLRTAFVPYARSFAPDDTVENLNLARVEEQYRFLKAYFQNLLADRRISTSTELERAWQETGAWASLIRTFRFDEFSASVLPQLAVEDTMVVLSPWITGQTHETMAMGDVINFIIYRTDRRATVFANNLTERTYVLDAYKLDDDYRQLNYVIDIGDVHDRYNANLNLNQDKTLALFACKEFPIRNRADTSLVGDRPVIVESYHPLEARQNSTPSKYGTAGLRMAGSSKWVQQSTGPGSILIALDDEIKLLTAQKRPIIGSTEKAPEGTGYLHPEEIPGDFFWLASHDLKSLNSWRLERMQGVTNELAEEAQVLGIARLREADVAREQNDHATFMRLQHMALGSLAQAYDHLRSINNDMLKAVVFYVALLLPFCFFVQKLCFSFVKIEKQMGMFALLFVATFMLFRMIHPAFKVAQAAEAIFIAFVMLALGLFVIHVLHSRFEGEMQALFQTYLGVTAEVGYSTVGQKAILIGLNNMKRRRVRTTLTTATIVLITFAMLAFSSVSRKMSPTMISHASTSPYSGIFYQWPGSLTMDESTLSTMQELFSDTASETVVRRWLVGRQTKFEGPMQIANHASGRQAQLDAVLGLPLADERLLRSEGYPILGSGRYFSSNNAREILLPRRIARALGIDEDAPLVGVSVTFQGVDYAVVGLLDGDVMRNMRDLNQLPILPIKEVTSSGWQQDEREANLNIDMSEANESSIFFVDPAALAVLPSDTARQLGANPFSISVVFKDGVLIWDMMDRMLRATSAKFFIGSTSDFPVGDTGERQMSAGVYYVGSGYKTSIGGLARLLVPLFIAGTIILNTMLGSVYERKSEIAVYNAIGLNPTHIRMFFLAEAFAYSVIGSVGGYLIGQMLAMGLIHFDLVGGLNLNFSSLMVVYVILFTIAVVLLSTIYPAHAATRMAVPSGQRKWALPEHDGKSMTVVFPFIYQPRLAIGVLSYLDQYFSRFTEASVGELIATLMKRERTQDEQGREVFVLEYDLALAPYDLGVTQQVVFRLAFDEVVQSYRLWMQIDRKSGQDSNWVTVNRPFLEKMRKYLIQWRNMDPAMHLVYVERALDSFDPARREKREADEAKDAAVAVPPAAAVEKATPDGTIGEPDKTSKEGD